MTNSSNRHSSSGLKATFISWPLWRQITTAIGIVVILVWFVSGVLIRLYERQYLLENLKAQNQETSSLISSIAIDAVITEDSSLLGTILSQTLAKDSNIAFLTIRNEDGKQLAHLAQPVKSKSLPPMEFTNQIEYEQEIFGSLIIAWNIEKNYTDIEKHITNVRIFLTVFILILTTLILFLVHWLAVLPIKKINQQLINIAGGDYRTPLEFSASSEFIRLAKSINQLSDLIVRIDLEIQNRRLAEEMQKEIAQKLEALIQASPLAIITIDTNLNIQSWNQSAYNMFGWQSNEVLGGKINIFPGNKINWFKDVFTQELEGKSFSDLESIAQKKDGTLIDIRFSSASIFNAEDKVVGTVTIIADITDRVRAEEKIQIAYKAGMAENAISVLHNIGNAITPTIVNTKELLEKKEHQQFEKYLTNLYQVFIDKHQSSQLDQYLDQDIKGKKMLPFFNQLIEQVRQTQKDEIQQICAINEQLAHITGIIILQQKYANIQSTTERFEIAPLVNDVLKMLQSEFAKRNIQIRKQYGQNLDGMICDKNKLVQILINLLKNAIEAIDEQLLTSKSMISNHEIVIMISKKNDLILFTIKDTGAGAEQEVLDHVFEFGKSTKNKGSGFGLHDCAIFIRSHKGQIQLTSGGKGKGATITFHLPCNI
jgi:PAS domain S-box-containing protein